MELLPHELRAKIPPLYSQENNPDPTVWVKFFDPFSNWTWYCIEGSSQDDDFLMFGWVVGFEKELGYFLLSELADIITPEADHWHASVGIERDLYFEPCPLSQVKGESRGSEL